MDLTPSELRLASLMRLNLNSKDIASTLNISPDSLRISRHRLKKKLALEKGESLQQFILGI
jgi:DNA-binding CsgD family transcriptional regulator